MTGLQGQPLRSRHADRGSRRAGVNDPVDVLIVCAGLACRGGSVEPRGDQMHILCPERGGWMNLCNLPSTGHGGEAVAMELRVGAPGPVHMDRTLWSMTAYHYRITDWVSPDRALARPIKQGWRAFRLKLTRNKTVATELILHALPAKAGSISRRLEAADGWVPAFAGTAARARFHPSRVGAAGGGLERNKRTETISTMRSLPRSFMPSGSAAPVGD